MFVSNSQILSEVYYDRGNQHDFISMVKELALPGILTDSKSFHFDFQQVEKPYESYVGTNVKLRYLVLPYLSPFK